MLIRLSASLAIAGMTVGMAACGGSDGPPKLEDPPDVYAAVVDRLENQDKVLHATATSVENNAFGAGTLELWIDEARNLARENQRYEQVVPEDRGRLIIGQQGYSYAGDAEPVTWEAPNCEGVAAPATSLLLSCYGMAGSRSELVDAGDDELRIVTTGVYGPDLAEVEGKPWSTTLTLGADSLLPLSLESDSWAVLNGEPYEGRDIWTYETEFVDRESLPSDLFELP